MFKRISTTFLCALVALGIFSASAMAGGSEHCTTGGCQIKPAEWVPGTIVAATTGSSEASTTFVKDVPVSKIKKVIRKEEKRKKIRIGFYQNPAGFQGPKSQCIDPEKVKRWNFHAGEFYKTTNHLREPQPPAHWKKGDKICNWHEVQKGNQRWVVGVQELCSNVKSELPVGTTTIKKPKYVYVQYPTIQKYWEIKMKHTEIKSEAKSAPAGAVAETPGHYTCPSGWDLVGSTCKKCPPPHCEPPEEPEEPQHYVQVECQAPEHIYTKDKVFMYCVTSNDNGALISLDVFSLDKTLATVGSQKSVDVKNQAGDPCPSGAQCFRETVTAGSSPGVAPLAAIATSNGAEGKWKGEVRIEEDDFGT